MGDNTSLSSDYYGPFSLYLGKALTFSLSLTFSIPTPVIAGSKHLFLAQITVSDRKSTTFYWHTSWPGLPWIPESNSVDSGFLVSGTWIPDYNRLRDSEFPELEVSGSKAQDFGLQSKSFEDSRIPDYFTWERYISQELNHLPVASTT